MLSCIIEVKLLKWTALNYTNSLQLSTCIHTPNTPSSTPLATIGYYRLKTFLRLRGSTCVQLCCTLEPSYSVQRRREMGSSMRRQVLHLSWAVVSLVVVDSVCILSATHIPKKQQANTKYRNREHSRCRAGSEAEEMSDKVRVTVPLLIGLSCHAMTTCVLFKWKWSSRIC